jgi:hypothetical protein
MRRTTTLQKRIEAVEVATAARQQDEGVLSTTFLASIPPEIQIDNPTIRELAQLALDRVQAAYEAGHERVEHPTSLTEGVIRERWGDPVAFHEKLHQRLAEAAAVYYQFLSSPYD